jgi:hypothetical protein
MTGQRDVRICFLGDSFTAGFGDPAGLGTTRTWPRPTWPTAGGTGSGPES